MPIDPPISTLNGRVALVTGAAGGIGLALAHGLADAGATVYLVGRDPGALQTAARTIKTGTTHVAACDLADDGAIERLCRTFAGAGRLDILAHCAGTIGLGELESITLDDFDHHYRVNARAPFLLTQRLLPLLRQDEGQLVFVNSSVAFHTKAGVGAYTASKHALRAIADTFRAELNPSVRVLSVYPGNTATPMQQRIQQALGKSYRPEQMLQPVDVAATILNALQLPRSAEVTDIHIRPLHKS